MIEWLPVDSMGIDTGTLLDRRRSFERFVRSRDLSPCLGATPRSALANVCGHRGGPLPERRSAFVQLPVRRMSIDVLDPWAASDHDGPRTSQIHVHHARDIVRRLGRRGHDVPGAGHHRRHQQRRTDRAGTAILLMCMETFTQMAGVAADPMADVSVVRNASPGRPRGPGPDASACRDRAGGLQAVGADAVRNSRGGVSCRRISEPVRTVQPGTAPRDHEPSSCASATATSLSGGHRRGCFF